MKSFCSIFKFKSIKLSINRNLTNTKMIFKNQFKFISDLKRNEDFNLIIEDNVTKVSLLIKNY